MQARGISIWEALRIPGVILFALALFFCKLVAYTFLYWLPYYLNAVDIGGAHLSPTVRFLSPTPHLNYRTFALKPGVHNPALIAQPRSGIAYHCLDYFLIPCQRF